MSHKRDGTLLEESYPAARNRLTRALLFQLVDRTCYRCGKEIQSIDDWSIDHKQSWRTSDRPRELFYDLVNIAYSHLDCNRQDGAQRSGEQSAAKTHCPNGHPYDEENTYLYRKNRQCRTCNALRQASWQRRGKAAIGVGNPS